MPVTLPTVSLMPPTVEFQLALDCGIGRAAHESLAPGFSEAARPLLCAPWTVLVRQTWLRGCLRVNGRKRKGEGSITSLHDSSASSNASRPTYR